MSQGQSTKELLEQWQGGDQSAATRLYEHYSQRLCALAEAQIGERLSRRVGADDIVQSVFRTFFRRARNGQFVVDHSSSLWQLLVRITLHRIQRQAERHRAERRNVSSEVDISNVAGLPEALAREPTPDEAAALTSELEAVLAELDWQEAETLRLCLQGHSSPEIAQRVGSSRWTVRRVLDRIGSRLQQRLQHD